MAFKLQTLKPRVQAVVSSRLPTQQSRSQQSDYRIRGRALQTIRAEHFRRHPLCVHCLAKTPPRISLAVELDHIVALQNGGKDEPTNRQGLCAECHEIKTREDNAIAGRGRVNSLGR